MSGKVFIVSGKVLIVLGKVFNVTGKVFIMSGKVCLSDDADKVDAVVHQVKQLEHPGCRGHLS